MANELQPLSLLFQNDALTEGKADAALAASLFHYKELEIRDLKEYLAYRSVSVRL